jgi:cobalamin biosynthesis protein CbiD
MENEIIIKLNQPFIDRILKLTDGDREKIIERASDMAMNRLASMVVEHVHERTSQRVVSAVCNEISKKVVFRLRREIHQAAKNATEIMLNELNTKRKIKAAVSKEPLPLQVPNIYED